MMRKVLGILFLYILLAILLLPLAITLLLGGFGAGVTAAGFFF